MLNEVYISKKLYHNLTPCVDSRKIVTVNVVGKNICLLYSDCVHVRNHFSKTQPILVSNHASQLSVGYLFNVKQRYENVIEYI